MTLSRGNALPIAGLMAVACLLRSLFPDRMSVEHFDEGVYASDLFCDRLEFRYPDQHLYAPPLLPALLEWSLILTGANPRSVMWVNVLLGTALVWGVWWTTREFVRGAVVPLLPPASPSPAKTSKSRDKATPIPDPALQRADSLGNLAGLAAAAVVAFSDLFLQYSRAALTDVPAALWMTLAVGTGVRGLTTDRSRWLIASTSLTALAWWTKYNGWLPLAILGAGSAGWILFSCPGRVLATRTGVRVALIAAGAVVFWLPWLSALQKFGGYSPVAANHRGYLVGWSGWISSVLQQLSVDRHYAGALTALGVLAAVGITGSCFTWNESGEEPAPSATRRNRLFCVILAAISLLVPFVGLVGVLVPLLAISLAVMMWRQGRMSLPGSSLKASLQRIPLSVWILAAWLIGLALSTPLYRPYPRLMLPGLTALIIATCVSLAAMFDGWTRKNGKPETSSIGAAAKFPAPSPGRKPGSLAVPVLVFTPLVMATFYFAGVRPEWQDRRGLERAAVEMTAAVRTDLAARSVAPSAELDAVFYIFGEPGLFYHLAARDDDGPLHYVVQPAANLGMLQPGRVDSRVTNYLVTGPHSVAESEQLQGDSRVQSVTSLDYFPSDLVLLDNVPPDDLPEHRRQNLQLWRIVTP